MTLHIVGGNRQGEEEFDYELRNVSPKETTETMTNALEQECDQSGFKRIDVEDENYKQIILNLRGLVWWAVVDR